jgi:hypothetical protein
VSNGQRISVVREGARGQRDVLWRKGRGVLESSLEKLDHQDVRRWNPKVEGRARESRKGVQLRGERPGRRGSGGQKSLLRKRG